MQYVYAEPIKNDIYRYPVTSQDSEYYTVSAFDSTFKVRKLPLEDGSLYAPGILPGVVWPETPEMFVRYQDSLSLRVSQHIIRVYFTDVLKRGKKNTRVLVIDDYGQSYHLLVPTLPALRVGESFEALRMDLTVVSLTPIRALMDRVSKARAENPDLP